MTPPTSRPRGPISLSTGRPAEGIGLFYFTMSLEDRQKHVERFFAEDPVGSVRRLRARLRSMKPGDTYYENWTHYVTVMPGMIRRYRLERVRLLRLIAQRQAQQADRRQHRASTKRLR